MKQLPKGISRAASFNREVVLWVGVSRFQVRGMMLCMCMSVRVVLPALVYNNTPRSRELGIEGVCMGVWVFRT